MLSLASKIESILFISNRPLAIKKLAELTQSDKAAVRQALAELALHYPVGQSGVILQQAGEEVQLATAGDNAKLVKEFIKEETTGELSRASLETLTIIAYRGPVSRAELEQIRGVNCAIILRNLLIRGLVRSQDDKKKMATTYEVTIDFLKFLGLSSQTELPDYQSLNANETLEKLLAVETGEEKG